MKTCIKKPFALLVMVAVLGWVLVGQASAQTLRTVHDVTAVEGRNTNSDGAFSACFLWFLAIATLIISIPNAFGSKETLARNSKLIGTRNLVVARTVCVIGVLVGWMMVLVAVLFTYHYANAIFSAGGLLAALVVAFSAYRHARAVAAKSAKANKDGPPKS